MFDLSAAPRARIRHFANPRFGTPVPRAPEAEAARIRAAVRSDPDYYPTPLLMRPHAARGMGLGTLALKYEGARLTATGLASFKPVAAMAALAWLRSRADSGPPAHTVVCASDGNYGRAVAWAARRAGLHARIFLPARVSPDRFEGVARFGAEAVAVAGGYDRAMAEAAAAARAPGVIELSDTGYPGSEDVPRAIGAGYGVIAGECLAAWPEDLAPPTHLFVPVGVGGLAAGLADAFDAALGETSPQLVTVEPTSCDSLLESLARGHVTSLAPPPDPATLLECLACETPSTTAWTTLARRVAHALAITDAPASEAVRALAAGHGDSPVVAGASGAAAYAGLAGAAADPALRRRLGLDARARVLVMISEGAADLTGHRGIVGGAENTSDASHVLQQQMRS